MFVSHRDEIEKKRISSPGSNEVLKQVLVGPEQGWKDHVMRMFTLGKEGCAPRHAHPWQHIIYVVEGKGNLFMDGKDYPLTPGSVCYVPSDILHQVSNAGEDAFVFICIVPEFGDK
ncbi:MAG: cupin domain-containing protein [Sphaerochaeta sp.]|nr:cupin domain-containing protein [Sphaerochaeta sp.]